MDSVSDVRRWMQETLWLRGEEFVRRVMQRWCQLVMEAERDAFLGYTWHERTPARRGWRNG